MKLKVDHIVISVKDLKRSTKFYSQFLGKAKVGKWDAFWQVGDTKLFLTSAYKKSAKLFDKHNYGLNHIAFGVKNIKELKAMEFKLRKSRIKSSGIAKGKYSTTDMIWFDDPDGIRLEFYLRP